MIIYEVIFGLFGFVIEEMVEILIGNCYIFFISVESFLKIVRNFYEVVVEVLGMLFVELM